MNKEIIALGENKISNFNEKEISLLQTSNFLKKDIVDTDEIH